MQGYVPGQDGAFGESRKCFGELEDWLASAEAAGLQHGELEEQLDVRGRVLLRQLFQDRLDLMAAREERRHDVTGPDGVPRTRAEKGRTRPLVTRFGQVTVSRIAYRSPGRSNVHPLDAALNLPEEKHSHGLRKLAAVEAARGSIEAAGDAVARATGVRIGKRQLEELARRAAAHVEAFYLWRAISPVPEAWPLVLTFDGKGIVMLPEALRPATAKAAAAAQGKLATRLSPGEKNGRKRMAELACVYDAAPVPRTPGDVISTPAQQRRKNQAQAGKPKGKQKPREPQARGKWLTASVTDDIPAVIAAAFDEAERRDLQHKREWVVLVDGNNTQIETVTTEAASRGITVTVVIDFIHVQELSTVPARDYDIFAGHSDVAIDVTTLRRCGRRVPAESDELAAELQVLAVGLLECGAQGLGFVAVLFLEVSDLAGQRVDDRVVAVAVAGQGRLRAGLGAQPLDPGAQVSVPVEECVGHACLALDGLEGDGLAALDQPADRLVGGGGLRLGLGFGCGREDGGAAGADVAHGWSFR